MDLIVIYLISDLVVSTSLKNMTVMIHDHQPDKGWA